MLAQVSKGDFIPDADVVTDKKGYTVPDKSESYARVSPRAQKFFEHLQSNEPEIAAAWVALDEVSREQPLTDALTFEAAATRLLRMATLELDDLFDLPVAPAERRRALAIADRADRLSRDLLHYYPNFARLPLQTFDAGPDRVMSNLLQSLATRIRRSATNDTRPGRAGAKITRFCEAVLKYLLRLFPSVDETKFAKIAHGLTLAAFYDQPQDIVNIITLGGARAHLSRILAKRKTATSTR
jgi:hypothetical protein